MAQIIIVNSAQLKIYLARFEQLLAQDPAERARLNAVEARRAAEWKRTPPARDAPPPQESDRKP
jgi:anti-sigma factor RsiW